VEHRGRTLIPAVAFSTDSDYSTFSDAEQATIKQVWQRVAEDYAPFNIDVTTERPATFGTRTAHAVITRNTDANGIDNPSSSAGGVAYVNVFGNFNYATYRPGWIYFNNLGGSQSSIAEAVSHSIRSASVPKRLTAPTAALLPTQMCGPSWIPRRASRTADARSTRRSSKRFRNPHGARPSSVR
jgi:hypothetical protein